MTTDQLYLVRRLTESLPGLTSGQLYWIERVVSIFAVEHTFETKASDLFSDESLRDFGEAMRVHHSFSAEPFSKDKFEYVLVAVLRLAGVTAALAPKGNPGYDVTINGIKVSLKTQADNAIKEDVLWISKFMELGKGS